MLCCEDMNSKLLHFTWKLQEVVISLVSTIELNFKFLVNTFSKYLEVGHDIFDDDDETM